MDLNKLYFYTASILNYKKLLMGDDYKEIIIGSLRHLVQKKKIKVYAFVIMPNHIHVIWELLESNGKEMPHASFMKYTAHQFQKKLRIENPDYLEEFRVNNITRDYQFWQRNALPIILFTKNVMMQKLNYIHNNPLQKHWNLAETSEDYYYSSAAYYKNGQQNFDFISHIGNWF
jgi:REP element-mobilizing transposase RayT